MIHTVHEDAIDRLTRHLRELQVEYEKFFNGALDIPPAEDHARLSKAIRKLRNTKQMNAVERFRFVQLEARFNTYSELFNRRLRHREEVGRTVRTQKDAADRPAWDPREGVLVEDRLPAAYEEIHGIADACYEACQEWEKLDAQLRAVEAGAPA